MDSSVPDWIRRHGLVVGEHYVTNDSDVAFRYLGHALVRDAFGYRYVMVFRDLQARLPLLTLNETDADQCAGFTPLGDHLADELDPGPND
jgi:hypothetical protein